jgi:hypothetical protein
LCILHLILGYITGHPLRDIFRWTASKRMDSTDLFLRRESMIRNSSEAPIAVRRFEGQKS